MSNPLETYNTIIHHTTNGGNSWEYNLEFETFITGISFINNKVGWLESNFKLFKTTDSGLTWEVINNSTFFDTKELIFTDEMNGYILAEEVFGDVLNTVYHTNDGGLSFQPVVKHTYLVDINIANNKLWAVGNEGQILSIPKKITTEIKEKEFYIPKDVNLLQNYPFPFNPATTISYELPERMHIQLDIYDILGRKITSLVSNEQNAGRYSIMFTADGLSGGIYFYSLQTNGSVIINKMILLK